MIKIEELKVLDDHKIWFRFSDNIEKIIDFTAFTGEDALKKPLANAELFPTSEDIRKWTRYKLVQ